MAQPGRRTNGNTIHTEDGLYFVPEYSLNPEVPLTESIDITNDDEQTSAGRAGRPTAPFPSLSVQSSPEIEASDFPECNKGFPHVIFEPTRIFLILKVPHDGLTYVERYMERYFGRDH